MQTQVEDFTRRVKAGEIKFNAGQTLFFVAGGLNDSDLKTKETITNLESEIKELYDAGGRYFLVALLPRKIPDFTKVSTRLDPAIGRIPNELRSVLPEAHIKVSRWGDYFDQIILHPSRYGITNTKDKCAGRTLFGEDPTPCATPDQFFYYHDGHPSTAVHRIVGREMAEEVKTFP